MRAARPTKQRESLADWITRTTPPPKPKQPTVKRPESIPPDLPRLIPVAEWAKLLMGEFAPHDNTLRRWIAEGHIQPMPVKIGKRWFVRPDAEYRE